MSLGTKQRVQKRGINARGPGIEQLDSCVHASQLRPEKPALPARPTCYNSTNAEVLTEIDPVVLVEELSHVLAETNRKFVLDDPRRGE